MSEVLQCWLLFCARMMSPVPCALSTMMLCLLKLLKHRVIWSLLSYWRRSTWLGILFFQDIFGVVFENFWWTNPVWQWQIDDFWWFLYKISQLSETQSHIETDVVLETHDLARWIISLGNFWWEWFLKLILPKTCMTLLQCQADDLFYKNRVIIRSASEYLHAECYSKVTLEISIHS